MGRNRPKLGSLAIQVHFTEIAELEGRKQARGLERRFPGLRFVESSRQDGQRYTTLTMVILK